MFGEEITAAKNLLIEAFWLVVGIGDIFINVIKTVINYLKDAKAGKAQPIDWKKILRILVTDALPALIVALLMMNAYYYAKFAEYTDTGAAFCSYMCQDQDNRAKLVLEKDITYCSCPHGQNYTLTYSLLKVLEPCESYYQARLNGSLK